MPKTIKKSKSRLIPYDPGTTKGFIFEKLKATIDPTEILKRIDELFIKHNQIRTEKEKEKILEEYRELVESAMNIVGLDTHYPIAETVTKNRTLIIQLAADLTKEFKCETASEKSLVHVISGAYARILEYSRLLNNCQRVDYLSHEKNGYYGLLSKELDRAHRQYTSSLILLRQIKTPELVVNVKAKNAFIAQNQQVNATQAQDQSNTEPQVYENVNSK